MSEYWKSTPKYWCKFCKVYVRDTKFERQQHEATGRHQNSIQRSLRDIHKTHEREQRASQRAKDEVERLKGVVSGSGGVNSKPKSLASMANTTAEKSQVVTPAERSRQVAKLAEMGLAVPEEFRREMAMAGDWQVVSERLVQENVSKEVKPSQVDSRKRKFGASKQAEVEDDLTIESRWNSKFKSYPTSNDPAQEIEALLANPKSEQAAEDDSKDEPKVKVEEAPEEAKAELDGTSHAPLLPPKQEDGPAAPTVIFKKRRMKASRQEPLGSA